MNPNNQPPTTPSVELNNGSRLSRFWGWLTAFRRWGWGRRLLTFIPLIAIIGGVIWAVFFNRNPYSPVASLSISAPSTVASPLTGIQVTPALAKRPVTDVMIENSIDARPQSGLESAGVVFEAVAEGGITRFSALFQEAEPQLIGPVRSVRPYYMDWVAPFQASVAHVGGSPDGLKKVRGGMRDLDEFFNPGSYWRSTSRAAPHNVYTSFAKLDALNKSKGYKTSTFTSWPRKQDAPLATPQGPHY